MNKPGIRIFYRFKGIHLTLQPWYLDYEIICTLLNHNDIKVIYL